MTKLVLINLGEGSLSKGFSQVTAQLWEADNSRPTQFSGGLPPAPIIDELYKRFQSLYGALYQLLRIRSFTEVKPKFKPKFKLELKPAPKQEFEVDPDFEIDPEGLTNISESDFADVCYVLGREINNWLNSSLFRPIDQKLRSRLSLDEDFQVIIETRDPIIQGLPWHLWDFLEDYPKAEIGLSNLKYEQVKKKSQKKTNKVRILAILGSSEGINVQQDRILLEQLPNTSMKFLVEPSRQELDKWLWDEQGWDILFFAGHSHSHKDKSKIHINQSNTLTIAELKNALKYAIARGLTLAIFNSCDGLGLAKELADLNIPQVIVMRENVPDLIAHQFLKNFLTAFAGGESLYLAVRYARLKLQGLENNFPAASWLPVICQNPAEITPTWEELHNQKKRNFPRWFFGGNLQTALITGVIASSFVVGMRSLGFIQQPELAGFDPTNQIATAEPANKRVLVIKVPQANIQTRGKTQKPSPSGATLQKSLRELKLYQQGKIDLNPCRNFSTQVPYSDFTTHPTQNHNLITICKDSVPTEELQLFSAPPGDFHYTYKF